VLVHRLVALDTIEERVLELQARKRGLLDAAIGEGGSVSLSRDEIVALLL
jgi:SNF2 family DNA or RNA helicase